VNTGSDLQTLTSTGWKLLIGEGVAANPQDGIARITEAARHGGPHATALLALFAAWGVHRSRDLGAALDLLQKAAELGWQQAQRELQFLAHRQGTDWAQLRDAVDLVAWTSAPPVRALREQPSIRLCEGFATAAECQWLINLASHSLHRAKIYRKDAAGHVASDSRTNTEANYTIVHADIVLSLIRDRLAAAAGTTTNGFEIAKLLHYEPGQQFDLHCDFQEPITPALRQEVERHGQRVATVLVYLNEDYEGGETDFPRAQLRHKGRRGDALVFANVTASGALDYDTLHAGRAPTSGVKWLLSQWIRSKTTSA